MAQRALLREQGNANEEIIKILLEQDELTWQNIIYELVKKEEMEPWDIDVSLLAHKFLEMIGTLQEMDFRITGKLVLAAALLLKIKSNKLLEEDLTALDALFSGNEYVELLDELPLVYQEEEVKRDQPKLVPRTPQPRKRKVGVDDLIGALEQALDVELRRVVEIEEVEVHIPKEQIDISKVIQEVYQQVHELHVDGGELSFTNLLPKDATKEEIVYTFIPLLHLDHQRNIDLEQKESFGEILITFLKELDQNFQLAEGDLGS